MQTSPISLQLYTHEKMDTTTHTHTQTFVDTATSPFKQASTLRPATELSFPFH